MAGSMGGKERWWAVSICGEEVQDSKFEGGNLLRREGFGLGR